MSDEDSLRHKYAPLPEEPRFKKKAKKRHVRSDHKHEYETVCIDAHSEVVTWEGKLLVYHLGARCKVCGRLRDVKMWRYGKALPESIPLYEVEDFFDLVSMRVLPDDLKVRG